jgi:predicted transcriptional regulator
MMSKRPYVTPEEVSKMKQLSAEGKSVKEIAEILGRNEQSVRKWLKAEEVAEAQV